MKLLQYLLEKVAVRSRQNTIFRQLTNRTSLIIYSLPRQIGKQGEKETMSTEIIRFFALPVEAPIPFSLSSLNLKAIAAVASMALSMEMELRLSLISSSKWYEIPRRCMVSMSLSLADGSGLLISRSLTLAFNLSKTYGWSCTKSYYLAFLLDMSWIGIQILQIYRLEIWRNYSPPNLNEISRRRTKVVKLLFLFSGTSHSYTTFSWSNCTWQVSDKNDFFLMLCSFQKKKCMYLHDLGAMYHD